MRSFGVRLDLLADAVFTRNAATDGVQDSLDYVPGSALLGAAAAACYASLGDDAFAAFHSGRVRFGDGRPLAPDGAVYLPAPLGWFGPKDGAIHDVGRVVPERVTVLCRSAPELLPWTELRQVRAGAVTADGRWWEAPTTVRTKSSVDPEARGAPRDGMLFAYEALAQGTAWRATIEADDDVPERVLEALRSAFDGRTIWLGRSKSGEYGRTRATLAPPSGGPAPDATPRSELAMLLASDLALIDPRTGSPSLVPDAEALGLPSSWTFAPRRSSVLVRRYSPWNARRRARDLERQVLRRGSVLVYEGRDAVTCRDVATRLGSGVGAYRQDGLGRVLVEPTLLASARPSFASSPASASTAEPRAAVPTPPLGVWMRARASARASEDATRQAVERMLEGLLPALRRARRAGCQTPRRSQWRQLHEVAARSLDPASLRAELSASVFRFENAPDGRSAHGVAGNAWRTEIVVGSGPAQRLGDALTTWAFGGHASVCAAALALLAKRVAEAESSGRGMENDPVELVG